MIVETHCHLDYLKARPIEETLKLSLEAGVDKIITIGVSPDNLDTVQNISKQHEQVYYTQGIHPHDARLYTQDVEDKIISRCSDKKMVAVGEIGLDYHYNNSPQEVQKEVFRKQLSIANKHNKSVVIHTRDADSDTADILKEISCCGVVHSFTSSPELARTVLDLGYYIGFNGIITFKNADNVRAIVELTPLERMLVETDSPFLAPIPHRGKENAPFNLPHIIAKIAEIKNVDVETVMTITRKNAHQVFPLD